MPVRAPVQGVHQSALCVVPVVHKNEASFSGRKSNYACPLALPLKRQIMFRRPVLSPIDRGIQVAPIVVVAPGDEPAAQLIEEEEVSYVSEFLRSGSTGLFPVPATVDSTKREEIPPVDSRDPSELRRQEKQMIDEGDIWDLGLQPGAAPVIGSIELPGGGAIATTVIDHLHSLQGLLRGVLPMLTAVPRTNYHRFVVGGVQPGDPTAPGVQEREGGWSVPPLPGRRHIAVSGAILSRCARRRCYE